MKFKALIPVLAILVSQIAMADFYEEGGKVTKKEKSIATRTDQGGFSRVIPQISYISATLTGNDVNGSGVTSTGGLGVGATLDLGHSNLVMETGLLYRQEGAAAEGMFASVTVNLNYLAIPVLAKYYFSGQDVSSAYIKGGVIPSYLISKSYKATVLGSTYSGSINEVHSFDLLVSVGVGGKIAMTDSTDFIIEADGARGVTSISKSGDVYNTDLTLTAGVGINL